MSGDRRFKDLFQFIIMLILMAGLVTLSTTFKADGFGGCGDDCSKCHRLTQDELRSVFREGGIPSLRDVNILSIEQAKAKGLWEIGIEKDGKKGILYLDFSKKYLILGQIIELKTSRSITQERFTELNRIDPSKIPLDGALLMGRKDAPKKIIVITDPDCPFCKRLHGEIKKILKERNDIVFYIILYPLSIHKDAYWKSKSIICSKSIKLLEDNFDGKDIPQPDCETDQVQKNIKLVEGLGINSTPTMIYPDGRVLTGFMEAKTIIELLKDRGK